MKGKPMDVPTHTFRNAMAKIGPMGDLQGTLSQTSHSSETYTPHNGLLTGGLGDP